jgi:predicted nucleic acid-binding protein
LARDPDDEFLIDLAVAAQADFLITYNSKDLQRVTQFGVVLVSPRAFLQTMGVIAP